MTRFSPASRILATIVLVLLAAGNAPVLAASPSPAKSQPKTIEDELRFQAGDETGNEIKALKTELLVMRSEKKALEQLEKLKLRYKGTRMEAEILFRLGEIYMRRARTERFFEVHKDSNEVVKFVPQMVKDASEVIQIRKAIKIYGDLEAKFPRFRAHDIVIFNTAYAFQQVGDDKKAEEQFRRLLLEHPNSPLAADSLLSLGEIFYGRRQFPLALDYFLKIKAHPEARVYPYGLYKAAWCRYNMQDEGGGIALLEEVIRFGHERAALDPNGKSVAHVKLDLRKEALGDLSLFFSEVRKADTAVEYFSAQAGELDPVPYILRLVEIYKRHSKYDEVDTVLRAILVKQPQSEQIASVHEELIWNADRQKKRSVSVHQLVELNRVCDGLDRKAPNKADCDSKVIDVSKKLGARLHAAWKKEKTDDVAEYALQTYEVYLQNTTLVGHEAAQVRYAYADLLFARNRYREASENYRIVNQPSNDKKNAFDLMKTDPKLAVDAAYGAIVALEKAVGEGKWSDEDEVQFGKLADVYIKRAPQGPFALDLKFKKAFIAYEKEKYDRAAPEFKAIGWSESAIANPKVMKAQDLYLDILNIRKDFKGLKEAAYALLSRGLEKGREEHLAKIRREAWFAEIAETEQKGESKKAVEMYKSFATENKGSDLAPRAWWNASQILFKVGDASGGANMCFQMNKLFPGASNAKECLNQAAQTFESIARLDLAAKVLLSLAELEPENKGKWRELAADFMGLSGSREAKAEAVQTFIKIADEKKPELRLATLEKAFALAKEMRDDRTLGVIRSKIESWGLEPAMSRFAVEEAEALYASGDSTKAFNLAKRVVGRESQLGSEKALAARARFLQARILEDEYRQQSVKARVEKIGIVLAIKTEKLEKAQKAFQAAVKIGDMAVSAQSLARLGSMYVDYSKTVRGMGLPADVPEADRKAFHAEIEQIALPMEEKGVEALAQAMETARKAGRLDGLAGELQEKIDRLNMKASPAVRVEVERLPRLAPTFGRRFLGAWIGVAQ